MPNCFAHHQAIWNDPQISNDLNPPPLVEDPDRFYRSGENLPMVAHNAVFDLKHIVYTVL
jgi:hypothetical protein